MKKNNKGFFLAETLIVISLVTLILAFVYPNLSKLYETFVLKTNYYDQVQDIQALKTIDYVFNDGINNVCYRKTGDEYESNLFDAEQNSLLIDLNSTISFDENDTMKLVSLYVTDYDAKATSDDYALNRYLKRIRRNKISPNTCRIIGVFKDGEEYRYASVEHGIVKDGELIYIDNLSMLKQIIE